MKDLVELTEPHFEAVITACGEICPQNLFVELAREVVAADGATDALMAPAVAGVVVRSGFRFCQERDPLVYFDFLNAMAHHVNLEVDRVIAKDAMGRPWLASPNHLHELPFIRYAACLLDDGSFKQPLTLAWGLVRDGLIFCEQSALQLYPDLLIGTHEFIMKELTRTERWAKRVLRH